MNIAKLERMIAVYESGSFRKAAKIFGMSQPALTWSIRQLEESLNLALFVRGPRGIKPTDACERLIVRARLIVSEQQRLLAEVERSSQAQAIELGVHPVMMNARFSRSIARFRQAMPDVALRIVEGYSSELHERLRQGEIDLAYCARAAGDPESEEFEFKPLVQQFYSVFARPDHCVFAEIGSGGRHEAHDWAQVAVPNLASDQGGAQDLMLLLESIGMTQAKAAVRSSSMSLIRSLVVDAGMLGMLPDDFVADELAANTLRRVPDTRVEAPPIGLLSVAGSYRSASVRQLHTLLKQDAQGDRTFALGL
ncbi:LysR family transcriptional regulator [Novosphingobium panipatense]|uniref:LysR family transcriptional regulator n=1 Tax=Novosphingobium TaxID=165696 RepID=UPI000CDB02A3|nr:LysR family transcriptional regulator [Novosphingobium sp. HII-3]